MIVYVTRPENHEVIMGGWRSFTLWTDEPHYYHWPEAGYTPLRGDDQTKKYVDRGWRYKGDRRSGCRVKPLVSQNPVLEQNAWRLAIWSCIPKDAGVDLEDALTWIDEPLPGEDPTNEFCGRNHDKLLWHYNKHSDSTANVHHRRFLMKMNLITADCALVIPRVHFFDGNKTLQTQDIEEPYASRYNYACPEKDMDDDIPF